MNKPLPGTRGSTLVFGVLNPKRKSFKRNSNGLEDFADYYRKDSTVASDDESLDIEDEVSELSVMEDCEEETLTDELAQEGITNQNTCNDNNNEPISDISNVQLSPIKCSPKKLNFNESFTLTIERLPSLSPQQHPSLQQHPSIHEGLHCNLSNTTIKENTSIVSNEKSTILKIKRKKRKKITAPASFVPPKDHSIVERGDIKYHRIPINPPTSFTPGVRRSKRSRIETLEPGDRLEYKCHWGNTPTNRLGCEAKNVLKPIYTEKIPKIILPKKKIKNNEYLNIVDPKTGKNTEERIVHPVSSIIPTNIKGESLVPGDDVSYQKFINNDTINCGHISFKRNSDKSPVRTGNNCFIFFVIRGSITATVNDQLFIVNSNNWFKVPPNTVYSVTNDSKSIANVIYIINKL